MKYNIEELQLSDAVKCKKVCDGLECIRLDQSKIERIKTVFENEIELALDMKPSSLQMENTYITELLDGTENGIFLAMDLGGTNLRLIQLQLANGEIANEIVQHYQLAHALRFGCGEKLFDYLAECVDAFAKQQKLHDNIKYPLGFTFSFPMRQNGLDSGMLVTWTKTFNCPSIVGTDAVKQLRASLLKCNRTNIEVLAILNDTTGTLMHGALLDKQTRIGIVLGTGSNGCYMENAKHVKNWGAQQHHIGEHHVIIDVEWGAFGDNGVLDFIKSEYDRKVDEYSVLINSFTYEKYIGGEYLGEICRVILQGLYEQKLFLTTLSSDRFPEKWKFDSSNVATIEQDSIDNTFENTKLILQKYFKCNAAAITADDLKIVRYVCGLVSLRAAQLVALTTSVLLNRLLDETDVTIAVDGSLYENHPRLKQWLTEFTKIWAPTKNSKYMLAKDSSGKGGALVAAIADKIRKRVH